MEALALMRALDAPNAEVRLETLARSGAPVRRALAALAGQLVATKGWDRLGYVRPRDYAVERLGLSARQVQDLAHVDHALRGLPWIDAAFVAGELTWTGHAFCAGSPRRKSKKSGSISRSARPRGSSRAR